MDKEIWKDIVGYEGLYQVSNFGRIKSLKFACNIGGKILKPRLRGRYFVIALYKNNQRKDYSIHRIVAKHFVKNKENKLYVNHKDENSLNNKANNLMWCTHKENMNWGTRNKRISAGNSNNPKKCKKVIQLDLNGNFIKEWNSIKEMSKTLKINYSHISACCRNEYGRKTAGGYKWKYAEKQKS